MYNFIHFVKKFTLLYFLRKQGKTELRNNQPFMSKFMFH